GGQTFGGAGRRALALLGRRKDAVLVLEGAVAAVQIPDHAGGDDHAQHQADKEADKGDAALRTKCLAHYMLSGAETPSRSRPLRRTMRVAAARARRACLTASSSTSMRSALYHPWKSAARSFR